VQAPNKLGRRQLRTVLLDSAFFHQLLYIFRMIRVFRQFRFNNFHLEITVAVNKSGFLEHAERVLSQCGIVNVLMVADPVATFF
jgi:hypothetical protein